jgi:hypothetical protein
MPRLGDDVHVPPRRAGPLLHADQTESVAPLTRRPEIESRTVVGDGELDGFRGPAGRYGESACAAVGGRVPHRFLRDSKQTERCVVTDVAEVALYVERHLDVVPLLDFDAVCFQGPRKTDVPERARVEVV